VRTTNQSVSVWFASWQPVRNRRCRRCVSLNGSSGRRRDAACSGHSGIPNAPFPSMDDTGIHLAELLLKPGLQSGEATIQYRSSRKVPGAAVSRHLSACL
jgi:hypothetical protein